MKINNRGQKITEISTRASAWSQDFIDTYTDNGETVCPFTRAEEQAHTDEHKEFLSILRTILPTLLGIENYTVYFLSNVKNLPYKLIAEHLGITEATARKKSERARKKIAELSKTYEKLSGLESELDMLAWTLSNQKEEETYEFNFEEMIEDYENNIKNLEAELGLKGE